MTEIEQALELDVVLEDLAPVGDLLPALARLLRAARDRDEVGVVVAPDDAAVETRR